MKLIIIFISLIIKVIILRMVKN